MLLFFPLKHCGYRDGPREVDLKSQLLEGSLAAKMRGRDLHNDDSLVATRPT